MTSSTAVFARPVVCALIGLAALAACQQAQPVYIVWAGRGNAEEVDRYYQKLNADRDLRSWLTARGFLDPAQSGKVLKAFYYNDSDLGLGREMQCLDRSGDQRRISCAVSNHGVPREFDKKANGRQRVDSIVKALTDLETFLANRECQRDSLAIGCNPKRGATVAMDFDLSAPADERVRFFIYDGEDETKLSAGNTIPGGLLKDVQLDSEGPKFLHNCLNCHGGQFKDGTIKRSTFLDFDVSLLVFGDSRELGGKVKAVKTIRADNEEPLRLLNQLILKTVEQNDKQPKAIAERIKGAYLDPTNSACNINTTGCRYNAYIPAGWAAGPKADEAKLFYQAAVQKHCATCHFAQVKSFNLFGKDCVGDCNSDNTGDKVWVLDSAQEWFQPQNLELIQRTTCQSDDMPHAEVTRENLKAASVAFSRICIDAPIF